MNYCAGCGSSTEPCCTDAEGIEYCDSGFVCESDGESSICGFCGYGVLRCCDGGCFDEGYSCGADDFCTEIPPGECPAIVRHVARCERLLLLLTMREFVVRLLLPTMLACMDRNELHRAIAWRRASTLHAGTCAGPW